MSETIETFAHTTANGVLHLDVQVGIPNADVAVTVQVRPLLPAGEVDANGWPANYFGQIAGSMPELEMAPQGDFETRAPLE